MPKEATQAPEEVQDTPINGDATPEAEGAPAEPQQPAVDYQKRYDDLVPEYTRGQQLIAAARGDHGPEAQMEALQTLGIEVQREEEAEEEDPFEDPYDKRIGKLEQELASKSEAEEQARFQALERKYIDSTVGDLEKQYEQQLGGKLTQREKKFVENSALANRHEDGRPDLEAAIKDVVELRKEARDGYIASKKSIKPPVGSAGEEKVDFSKMTPDEREAWMAQDVEARMAAES